MPYTVTRGDTLSAIAAQHGTTVDELMASNPDIADPNVIQVGQVLQIPGQDTGTSEDDGILDTTQPIDEATEEAILEIFPSAAYWLTVPEIREVLDRGVEEGWSPDRLRAAIEDTSWWQSTEASVRVFDEQELRDPATTAARIEQQAFVIRRQAMQAGIGITTQVASDVARNSLRFGWSEEQVRDALFQAAGDANISGIGSIATDAQTIKGMARQYHVPISDEDANMYALRLFNGTLDFASIQTLMTQNAKAMFPHLAEQLDMGLTVEDYMRPLINVAAQELDMNPNAIDLTGTKFSELYALDSYSSVRDWARAQDEWQYTDRANDEADQMNLSLLKTMGVLA